MHSGTPSIKLEIPTWNQRDTSIRVLFFLLNVIHNRRRPTITTGDILARESLTGRAFCFGKLGSIYSLYLGV